MSIANLSVLVTIATIANLVCLVLLAVLTAFNVQNYKMLRRTQSRQRPTIPSERYDSEGEASRPLERSIPATARTRGKHERVDTHDVPDTGQAEWTGPVTPYIPKDRQA
jgi:hypothetical protein